MNEVRHVPVAILCLLCVLCTLACSPQTTRFAVSVDGITDATRSLSVRVERPGENDFQPRLLQVTRFLTLFYLEVPIEIQGTLSLRVRGLDQDGCMLAEGRSQLMLSDGEAASTTVQLQANPAGCTFHVVRSGTGTGEIRATADPIGDLALIESPAEAGSCMQGPQLGARLSPGTRVRLTAEAAPGTLFAGWSGACLGTGPCEVIIGDGEVRVAAAFTTRQVCSGAYCWEHPLPQGNDLHGVWSFENGEAWVVGNSGTLLRWQGSFWSQVPTCTTANLNGIWARAPDDLWIVGNGGTVLHWDGTTLKSPTAIRTAADLTGVYGSNRADGSVSLWVIGHDGSVHYFDGASWQDIYQEKGSFWTHVFGSGPDDVWVLGYRGDDLSSVNQSRILHDDGKGLRPYTDLGVVTNLSGGGSSGPGETWLFITEESASTSVLHRSNGQWSTRRIANRDRLLSAWGSSPDDVWLVGNSGLIVHWDGAALHQVPSDTSISSLQAVHGSGPTQIIAVGGGGNIAWFNGAVWNNRQPGTEHILRVFGSAAGGPNDVYAVSTLGLLLRRNAEGWVKIEDRLPFVFKDALWNGADDIWIVGSEGAIFRRKGMLWGGEIGGGADLQAIWAYRPAGEGAEPAEVWVVGGQGTVLRKQGTGSFAAIPTDPKLDWNAVWGSSPADVWLAGVRTCSSSLDTLCSRCRTGTSAVWSIGVYRHFDGTRFDTENCALGPLKTVFGTGPENVWLGGIWDHLVHVTGPPLARRHDWVETATTGSFLRITGSGPSDLWAMGVNGTLFNYDGTAWTRRNCGIGSAIYDLFRQPSTGDVFTVGEWGSITHASPGQ